MARPVEPREAPDALREAYERVEELERALNEIDGRPSTDRVERLIADAEARVRAADDQAEAAAREATEARAEAAAAERRARELSALVANGQRRLTSGELSELREGGPSGPAVLASALRRLAKARAAGDRAGLASALAEVASAAVRWSDRI